MYGKRNIHSVDGGKNDNNRQSEAVGWGAPLRNPLVSGVAEWRTPPGRGGRSPPRWQEHEWQRDERTVSPDA